MSKTLFFNYFSRGPFDSVICENLGLINMYGLLTKCEVKMAGYWSSSFFACLWTETESRSINTQKKNEANIQPS